ncbi:MAG: ArgE/DapE family deacylase [Victivallales bacterium]|nr:ArgE/DapE family deacylase [Victivallales bacterium]
MDNKKVVKNYFKENHDDIRNEIIELVTRFVKEKTVNVPTDQLPKHPDMKLRGEEFKVADILKGKLNEYGIPYKEYARIPERPNIIASMGNKNTGKSLLMPAHMDVVPAGDGWDTDPYEVSLKDEKLYGRGTSDNKGQLASILVAGKILKKLGLDSQINGELQIAGLSDEEAGDPDGVDYGIEYLIEENFIDPTYAVIPDIGEYMKTIDVAEKGRVSIEITSIGKQAHGSTPNRGVNAIYMMSSLIEEIRKMKLEYKEHPMLGHPTMNLGMINGGAATNIVPGKCTIGIDCRIVPGMSEEQLIKQLKECTEKIENGKFEIKVIDSSRPHGIDPDNAVVEAIKRNATEILGFEPEPMGMGGGTYAKGLCLNGTIAVGWGIGNDETFHVANEYIEIEQLMSFAQITCLLALDLLK